MKGEANPWTYSRTGLYGNDYKSLTPLKYESRNFDIKNHITAEVPALRVVWPYVDKGANIVDKALIPFKGILG